MILLFLGDWKSTLIIAISIPLVILASLAALSALGQTINIMTLGGLALAVGILVDDATVTIENIDRHLGQGTSVSEAIRDGAGEIATPALVSTMCICIVFVPIFFLAGVAKYLFAPLAEAVIFAMIASYILSRTLVPTLAMYWMKAHAVGTSSRSSGASDHGNHGAASLEHVPGAVDLRIQEPTDVAEFNVKIDRTLASIEGVSAQAITQSVLGALSGSSQVSPNFWVDPRNRVSYQINAEAPQYDLHSLDDLRNLPILGGTSGQAQILANVASIMRATTTPIEDHYNIRPVINIYAGADGKDLGYVSDHVQKLVDASKKDLPRGSFISVRGQVTTMHESYTGLYVGLAFSMLLAYLLMVVNFQSWIQPLIIITALPCALTGIIWMLFVTGTTLSVPALMGAIMCMGVATANSVLVVTFANELLEKYKDPYRAALEAGYVRIRPVLMTALAMIIGMVPMALGLGEGGEQNAPLGRAVIGGLILATAATLFFVPTIFMLVNNIKRVGTQDVSVEAALG